MIGQGDCPFGADGAFCAGADLKAIATGSGNQYGAPKQVRPMIQPAPWGPAGWF